MDTVSLNRKLIQHREEWRHRTFNLPKGRYPEEGLLKMYIESFAFNGKVVPIRLRVIGPNHHHQLLIETWMIVSDLNVCN